MKIYVLRLPEDVTLMPKHVGVILIMKCVLRSVFNCMFLSAFLFQYISFRLFPRVHILST